MSQNNKARVMARMGSSGLYSRRRERQRRIRRLLVLLQVFVWERVTGSSDRTSSASRSGDTGSGARGDPATWGPERQEVQLNELGKKEWEYVGSGLGVDEPSESQQGSEKQSSKIIAGMKVDHGPYPSRRLGPGTWLDSNGYWWVYGGQGPTANIKSDASEKASSIHYLSDLWVYGPSNKGLEQAPYWRLVYRPENDGESPLSSNPEDAVFPLLTGSEASGRLGVFGGRVNEQTQGAKSGTVLEESHNSLFTEDSVVWLFDIPKSVEKSPRRPIKSKERERNWSGQREAERSGCNGTEGLWTSYICCDACLPDGNTTFDFCPQFSSQPILWSNRGSIMALQLTLNITFLQAQGKESNSMHSNEILTTTTQPSISFPKGDPNVRKTSENSTKYSSPSHISKNNNQHEGEAHLENSSGNSQGVGQLEKPQRGESLEHNEKKVSNATEASSTINGTSRNNQPLLKFESLPVGQGIKEVKGKMSNNDQESYTTATITTKITGSEEGMVGEINRDSSSRSSQISGKIGPENGAGSSRFALNWWKFDLTSREWIKMPKVNVSTEGLAEQLQGGTCRSVSDSQDFLYILCPTKSNLLDRSVLLFDLRKGTIILLGTIQLNNAFHDKKVWHLGRSVFHALSSNNQTVILLAYHKLLDLWIHDHKSNRLYTVENVWKGSSLHEFQHVTSFYKLTLALPALQPSTDANSPEVGEAGRMHTIYMANPRANLFSFDDPYPDGHFRVTIVPDQDVFLPARDAPLLSSSTDTAQKSDFFQENTPRSSYPPSRISHTTIIPKVTTTATDKTKELSRTKFTERGSGPSVKLDYSGVSHSSAMTRDKLTVPEGMTTGSVTGLRKALGSSFNTTTTSERPLWMTTGDATSATKGDGGSAMADLVYPSQSKLNTTTQRNYTKTNNIFPSVSKQVYSKEKRKILGIKWSIPATRIASFVGMNSSNSGGGTSTTMSSNNTSSSLTTMKSKAVRTSLKANNESNRKPLSAFRESPANFTVDMPAVIKVLNNDSSSTNSKSRPITPNPVAIPTVRNQSSAIPSRISELEEIQDGNLSPGPQVSALRVAMQLEHPHQLESLAATLTENDQANAWNRSSESSAQNQIVFIKDDREHGSRIDDHDKPNLRDNYVPSPSKYEHEGKEYLDKNQKSQPSNNSLTRLYNKNLQGEVDPQELTYGASEIVIDSSNDNDDDDSQPVDGNYSISYSSFGSLLFFSLSLSIFATFGLILFVRRCVKCPPRRESVLLKEPPPIHYSVDPDELSFHTPLV